MKKKKQNSAQPPPTTTATTTGTVLKPFILDHSRFEKFMELIPAEFFHSLDPEQPQSSTLELLKQNIENEKQALKSEDEQDKDIKPIADLDGGGDDRSFTYEELRKRVHRRIEELRGKRGSGERSKFEKRDTREIQQKKRKRGDEVEEKSGRDGKGANIGKSKGEFERDVTEAVKGIAFGKVKVVGEEEEEEEVIEGEGAREGQAVAGGKEGSGERGGGGEEAFLRGMRQ